MPRKKRSVPGQKFSLTIDEAIYVELTVIAARRKMTLSELMQLVSAEFVKNNIQSNNISVS